MSDEEVIEQEDVSNEDQSTDNEVDTSTDTTIEELTEKLAAAEQKATDSTDQMLRTRAEMENLRRRTQKDLENAHKFALEKFSSELL